MLMSRIGSACLLRRAVQDLLQTRQISVTSIQRCRSNKDTEAKFRDFDGIAKGNVLVYNFPFFNYFRLGQGVSFAGFMLGTCGFIKELVDPRYLTFIGGWASPLTHYQMLFMALATYAHVAGLLFCITRTPYRIYYNEVEDVFLVVQNGIVPTKIKRSVIEANTVKVEKTFQVPLYYCNGKGNLIIKKYFKNGAYYKKLLHPDFYGC